MIDGTDGKVPQLAEWLRVLDPATEDPNYWLRFRSWVVESAGPELARRRVAGHLGLQNHNEEVYFRHLRIGPSQMPVIAAASEESPNEE